MNIFKGMEMKDQYFGLIQENKECLYYYVPTTVKIVQEKWNEEIRVKMQNYRDTMGHLFSLGNFLERYSPTLPTHKEIEASAGKVN